MAKPQSNPGGVSPLRAGRRLWNPPWPLADRGLGPSTGLPGPQLPVPVVRAGRSRAQPSLRPVTVISSDQAPLHTVGTETVASRGWDPGQLCEKSRGPAWAPATCSGQGANPGPQRSPLFSVCLPPRGGSRETGCRFHLCLFQGMCRLGESDSLARSWPSCRRRPLGLRGHRQVTRGDARLARPHGQPCWGVGLARWRPRLAACGAYSPAVAQASASGQAEVSSCSSQKPPTARSLLRARFWGLPAG